jgi:hypothetical protein
MAGAYKRFEALNSSFLYIIEAGVLFVYARPHLSPCPSPAIRASSLKHMHELVGSIIPWGVGRDKLTRPPCSTLPV